MAVRRSATLPGATIATLSFTTTTAQNGNEYRAVFSNTAGLGTTTSAAILTVDFAPTVTTNPTNQTVNAGGTATFTAAASDGNPTPTTVQWQVSTDGGQTFSDIPGATIATLSFTTTAAQNGNEYRAVFSNTAGLSATTSAATLTVDFAPRSPRNPTNQTVNAGGTATFMAAASDGNPTPTTVQWQVSTDGGKTFSDIAGAPPAPPSASPPTAAQNGDEYQAVFSNTAGLNATTSAATLTVKVALANTTTMAALSPKSPNPSVFGQSVTFTATVNAVAPASGTPTGSVTFLDGSITLGTATLSSGGKATLTTKVLPAGSDTITAVYSGDSNFTTSTSTALTQTVYQDATTTTVVSSASPSVYGQSVTFKATVNAVAPGSGTPTGSVTFTFTFLDGSTTQDTAPLNSGGKATFTTKALPVGGSYTITAVYGGDSNFTTSTSTALTQTVNQDATTTTVASSANSSVSGQPITFTATVKAMAPGSGVPTGTVTFFDGSTSLGTALLNGSGHATISISNLAVGPHTTITASYVGDGNFTASVSSALTQTVKQDATKTTVSSSANPSGSGKPVTFTATVKAVAPGIGTPTGTVTFSINGTPQSPVPLRVINGVDQATFTTAPLSAGTYTITAVYDGDSNFITSTSAAFSQKVK